MADDEVEPYKVYAGRSAGNPCNLCGKSIAAGDVEYELEFSGHEVLRAHIDCFVRCLHDGPSIRGGSADSPWTLIFHRRIALTARRSRSAQCDFLVACVEARSDARRTRVRAADARGCRRRAVVTALP